MNYGVFISYSHEDIDHVNPIIDVIKVMRRDIYVDHSLPDVFHDRSSLVPGKLWEDQIFDAIDMCRLIVIFWCSHAAVSNFVKKEVDYAFSQKKDILPLLLDDTELLEPLSLFQWIDLRRSSFHNIQPPPRIPDGAVGEGWRASPGQILIQDSLLGKIEEYYPSRYR